MPTALGLPKETYARECTVLEELSAYHQNMAAFRTLMMVPAIVHALFVGFTALVGAYAVGGVVVNVAVDPPLSQLIAAGSLKGDWWLSLSVAPAIGIVYALTLLRASRPTFR